MMMKFNNKIKTAILMIFIVIIIFILLGITISVKTNNIFKKMKSVQNETTKDIVFSIYSNENNILKYKVNFFDTENGLSKIKYFDKSGIEKNIECNGKKSVAIDYEIENNGTYTFETINTLGEKIKKDLTVTDEYRSNLIKFSTEDLDENSVLSTTLDIDYGENNFNADTKYKVGINDSWHTYTGTIILDSYEIAENNYQNDDKKSVTIYAAKIDSAGNMVMLQKNINTLILDIPSKPVITPTYVTSYPVLTLDGIAITANVTITYEEKEGFENFYSLDSGKTWQTYTGTFSSTSMKIMAKSFNTSTNVLVSSEYDMTIKASDALEKDAVTYNAYDGNISTGVGISGSGGSRVARYVRVDSSMWGHYIQVYAKNTDSFHNCTISMLDSDKSTSLSSTTLIRGTTTNYAIPENTYWIKFYGSYVTILEIGPVE